MIWPILKCNMLENLKCLKLLLELYQEEQHKGTFPYSLYVLGNVLETSPVKRK